jgi:4-diphosphocytidyl-2-C-methyl-D-erythritol kinase
MVLRAEAPAKINRELRVGGVRPDGFHEIRSRFCAIDFCDRLEAEDSDALELSCSGIPVPAGDSNLVMRAARALAAALGVPPRARIRLEKRVPPGSGLGGGSSDAAVALLLLSRLWRGSRSPLTRGELVPIAASVGSDVPFFLFGGEADVAGRGERVTPREDLPATEVVLFLPPLAIETAGVYAAHDRLAGGAGSLPERLEIETSSNFLGPNDLASAVLQTHGEMVEYWNSARLAAREASITGSGSGFVLCGLTSEAEKALGQRHPEAAIRRVRTLGRADYERKTAP